MAEMQKAERTGMGDNVRQPLKRRGILVAAGAVVAGIVAREAAQPVKADTFAIPGSYTAASMNNPIWAITNTATSGSGSDGVLGIASAASAAGVHGTSTGASGFGVVGNNTGGANGIGVQGISAGLNGTGVYGQCDAMGATGVAGVTRATNGVGVSGISSSGTGIYGVTNAVDQYGVLGTTTATTSTAIAGIANTNGSSAFSGGTTNPAAYAGVFQGNVVIQGRLVVSDPSYKSGVLLHPDGSHRLVYCLESPESWIEDFGKGQLVNGKATVTFDKDFAAVVHTDDYYVFPVAEGETNGLYVTNKTLTDFTIQEQRGGTASVPFAYRVVTKPKSTVKQERLATFTMPHIPLPDIAKLPRPLLPTTPPAQP